MALHWEYGNTYGNKIYKLHLIQLKFIVHASS